MSVHPNYIFLGISSFVARRAVITQEHPSFINMWPGYHPEKSLLFALSKYPGHYWGKGTQQLNYLNMIFLCCGHYKWNSIRLPLTWLEGEISDKTLLRRKIQETACLEILTFNFVLADWTQTQSARLIPLFTHNFELCIKNRLLYFCNIQAKEFACRHEVSPCLYHTRALAHCSNQVWPTDITLNSACWATVNLCVITDA